MPKNRGLDFSFRASFKIKKGDFFVFYLDIAKAFIYHIYIVLKSDHHQ